MKPGRGGAVAALLVALAGCAMTEPVEREEDAAAKTESEAERAAANQIVLAPVPVPPPAKPAPEVLRLQEIDGLLSDFERFRRVPPTELTREQELARQAFNQSRSDAARMRLAMALAVPGAAASNETAALEVLEPLVKNPTVPLHGLAFMLAAYIQEQRRLSTQLQGLQQNVQGLQQNLNALQQKLDALRTLERSLTEREPAGTARRR
jgi:hypothetical protein